MATKAQIAAFSPEQTVKLLGIEAVTAYDNVDTAETLYTHSNPLHPSKLQEKYLQSQLDLKDRELAEARKRTQKLASGYIDLDDEEAPVSKKGKDRRVSFEEEPGKKGKESTSNKQRKLEATITEVKKRKAAEDKKKAEELKKKEEAEEKRKAEELQKKKEAAEKKKAEELRRKKDKEQAAKEKKEAEELKKKKAMERKAKAEEKKKAREDKDKHKGEEKKEKNKGEESKKQRQSKRGKDSKKKEDNQQMRDEDVLAEVHEIELAHKYPFLAKDNWMESLMGFLPDRLEITRDAWPEALLESEDEDVPLEKADRERQVGCFACSNDNLGKYIVYLYYTYYFVQKCM